MNWINIRLLGLKYKVPTYNDSNEEKKNLTLQYKKRSKNPTLQNEKKVDPNF